MELNKEFCVLYVQSNTTVISTVRIQLHVSALYVGHLQVEILCITRTVEHNYNSTTSTVRIQLHVSVLYVDHLQVEIFNLQISYTRCVGHLGGRGEGEISPTQPPTHLS